MAIILFPVGRMIGGSLEKLTARTEQDGKTPKLDKAGQPSMTCNFGVAIPKTQADWRNEPWARKCSRSAKPPSPFSINRQRSPGRSSMATTICRTRTAKFRHRKLGTLAIGCCGSRKVGCPSSATQTAVCCYRPVRSTRPVHPSAR